MKRVWQGVGLVFAVLFLAHYAIAVLNPLFPVILIVVIVVTICVKGFGRHRRW